MNDKPSHPSETPFFDKKTPPLPSDLKVRPVIQVLGLTVLFIGFAPFLWKLARFAFNSDLYSYILIIPPLVIYLLFLDRKKAALEFVPSLPLAAALLCIAFIALLLSQAGALTKADCRKVTASVCPLSRWLLSR